MKYGLQICFAANTFTRDLRIFLFESLVKFEPQNVSIQDKTVKWSLTKWEKELSKTANRNLFIGDELGNSFYISAADKNRKFDSVLFRQCASLGGISEKALMDVMINDDFISAYLFNADYEMVQSCKYSGNIDESTISSDILNSISHTPYKEGMFGTKEYDTRYNPGRTVWTSHTQLMVAWRMWFGRAFFSLIEKDKILTFPDAVAKAEINDNLVFVQLYEDIKTPFVNDAVERQWSWRKWIEIDRFDI